MIENGTRGRVLNHSHLAFLDWKVLSFKRNFLVPLSAVSNRRADERHRLRSTVDFSLERC